MQIHEAAEMYLETILVLSQNSNQVRMIDVAAKMGYSRPTVSVKLKEFRENGYIYTDGNGYITLTEKGLAIAEKTYTRHRCITEFLTAIGVSPAVAAADACKMEHDISDETFECMKAHYKKHIN